MEIFLLPEIWLSLLTLTVLEIVLGIDNVIFISILAGKLPKAQQARARRMGLILALVTRLMLLSAIAWMAKLTTPITPELFGHALSGRDLILLAGGLFLLFKATHEIHEKLEGEEHTSGVKAGITFTSVIIQILLLDIVFSLDSVITAIGMSRHLPVMIIAVVIALIFMLAFSGPISNFVNQHPTVKMLALSFLLLIGFTLIVEAFHVHIPKGYIYFAMAFSIGVELLNLRVRAKVDAVRLHQSIK
jgi:predicted tellurium resistance membrane protein TerC